MTERNSKTTFTEEEYNKLIDLVKELEKADRLQQKVIRGKLRKIGLYWSEVAPTDMKYTVANLKVLFKNGTLKIKVEMASFLKDVLRPYPQ